jgi:hypothetical protein
MTQPVTLRDSLSPVVIRARVSYQQGKKGRPRNLPKVSYADDQRDNEDRDGRPAEPITWSDGTAGRLLAAGALQLVLLVPCRLESYSPSGKTWRAAVSVIRIIFGGERCGAEDVFSR